MPKPRKSFNKPLSGLPEGWGGGGVERYRRVDLFERRRPKMESILETSPNFNDYEALGIFSVLKHLMFIISYI